MTISDVKRKGKITTKSIKTAKNKKRQQKRWVIEKNDLKIEKNRLKMMQKKQEK